MATSPGFSELTQVDTFYNGLNENEQDSLNAAAGGNLLSKTTREALNIIENKSKVRYSRNKTNASKVNSRENVSKTDERIDKLADQLSTLVEIVFKKVVTPAPVKAVEENCVTCGGAHAWNPRFPKGLYPKSTPIPEPEIPKTVPKANIPYPSRRDNQKNQEKSSYQKEKIFHMFQDLRFDISFADALFLMPRFAPAIRDLLMNKEKLLELVKIPLNENCSAMLLKKLPEKLGDPGKFLIPCEFLGMEICHALADLDIYVLEQLLNDDPFQLPPWNLKQSEVTEAKSLIEEPPELELKDLPSHLESVYWKKNDKFPFIIAKEF
ncbi:hypothetical protein Tco_1274514 [Tanacetum coccineum]